MTAGRNWAIALGLSAVVLVLGAAVGRDPRATLPNRPDEDVAARVTGVIATDWLPAAEARRDIEARTADLLRVARSHGSDLRILATQASLRIRSGGARLEQPLARFERSVEMAAPGNGDAALRSALSSIEVTLVRGEGRQIAQRRETARPVVLSAD